MCTHCALDQENMAVVQVLLLGYIGKVPQILRVLAGAVDVLNLVLANSALKIMPNFRSIYFLFLQKSELQSSYLTAHIVELHSAMTNRQREW